MAEKIFFKAWAENIQGGAYRSLNILVLAGEQLEYVSGMHSEVLEFTFQADPTNEGWYAFKINIKAENLDDISRVSRIARRILNPQAISTYDLQPHALLDRLAKVGQRVEYDGRISRYVRVEDLKSPEYSVFCSVIGGTPWNSVLDMDEESARQALREKFVEEGQDRMLGKWAEEGYPVKKRDTSYARYIPALPLERLLAVPW